MSNKKAEKIGGEKYISVDLPNLFKVISGDLNVIGIRMGLAVAIDYLVGITERAIELDDEVLLALLYQLGFVESENHKEQENVQKILKKVFSKKGVVGGD